mgnify:CR=1 FL=1|tara:strand:- start:1664 stop:2128 length:465 start_codon:yes stop_codon:yes gene_type:complete
MEMVTITYVGEQLIYVLSSGLLSAAVSDTSSMVLSLFKNSIEYPQLTQTLEETDIYCKLSIIQKLLDNFPENLQKDNDAIKTSLSNLHDIVISINNELQLIDSEICYHENNRYFSYYRTPNYKSNLKQLKKFKIILDNRFEDLIRLMNIFKVKL